MSPCNYEQRDGAPKFTKLAVSNYVDCNLFLISHFAFFCEILEQIETYKYREPGVISIVFAQRMDDEEKNRSKEKPTEKLSHVISRSWCANNN